MQFASEQMYLILLPTANAIYASENSALMADSAQATGLPLIVVALMPPWAVRSAVSRRASSSQLFSLPRAVPGAYHAG